MALNIGELFGTIGLDASNWDRELAGAQGNLQKFGVAGAAIAATAAVAIGAALSAGIAESINVEAGNNKIQAQLGLTEEQSAVAGKAAGSLFASNYGESMADVQDSVGVVMSSIKGMRDASDADVAAMTAKMMTLATVMEVDIARASQVAGQMITSGIAVDGTHAADLLAASLQKVPAAVREDILDAVDEYGPFMSQLGIKGEEAMGLLVNASEKGMYGIDKVGDALKEFTIRSTDMSKATGEAYEALGLNQDQMSADLLAGGEVGEAAFAKIIAGLQTMDDPVAQSAAALALFGTPLEDLSVNEIPQFLGQIDPLGDGFESVAGSADKMGQDLASNAASGFGSFKRQAQAALVDFVQVNIMPSVTQLATFLSTTVGPAITQVGGWITTNLMPALQAFGGWLSENQGTIALVAGIIGTLLIPVFIRLAVQAAITAVANVTAWVLMGAGAVKAAAIYVATSYRMIGSFIATAVSMAVNAARVVAGWVLMGAQATAQGIKIAAVWTGSVIASAARGAAMMAVHAARVVASWVLMGARAVAQGAIMATGWVLGIVVPAATAVASFLVASATILAGWISMAVAATVNAVIMAAAWLAAFWPVVLVGALVFGLVALVIANWDLIKSTTISIFQSVASFLSEVIASIVQFFVTGWTNLKNTTTQVFDSIVSFVTGIPGRFLAGLAAIGQLAAQMGLWILGMKNAAVEKFLDIVSYVSGIPGMILSALGNLGGLLVNAGGQILSGFLSGLKAGFENVKNFIGGIGSWIAENKGPKAYDLALLVPAGGWIMDGLQEGLRNQMGSLRGTLGDVSSLIESGIRPELAVSGTYTGTGGMTAPGTASSAALGGRAALVSLDPEDRALLRAVAERGFSVQIGSRVVAEANIEGRKALRLPA